MELHAFGPPLAAGLLLWSLLAIRERRLLPRWPEGWRKPSFTLALTWVPAGLLGYWAIRLGLQWLLGWRTFPAG